MDVAGEGKRNVRCDPQVSGFSHWWVESPCPDMGIRETEDDWGRGEGATVGRWEREIKNSGSDMLKLMSQWKCKEVVCICKSIIERRGHSSRTGTSDSVQKEQ